MSDQRFSQMAFAGYGVELHPVTPCDLPSLRRWRNSPKIQQQMLDKTHIAPDRQRRWFESLMNRNDQAHWVVWCNGVRTGHVNVRSDGLLGSEKSVHGGYYVADTTVRYPLLGLSAILMYHDIIFDHIGAKEIIDTVLNTNSTARKFNEQMGYRELGELKGIISITLNSESYHEARKKFLRYFKDTQCLQIF